MRSDSEAASRLPDRLAKFRTEAAVNLALPGHWPSPPRRNNCANAGHAISLSKPDAPRAASVGWPDAHAFTKALGEQALIDSRGDVPVSIVRPSIIESAWPSRGRVDPRVPDGRAGDPPYGRGLLREPGVPEGTVDVIPVDLVVAAIITVAALGPEAAPPICQVASGAINPLKYRASSTT